MEPFSNPEAVARKNRGEFARMFLGPKKLIAPPYESAYRSASSRIWGTQSAELRSFYRNVGICRDGSVNEPDDFIGFELQCAGYLLTAAQHARKAGRKDLCIFVLEQYHRLLFDHLTQWVPAFCEDVLNAEPDPFMAACARTLQAMIQREQNV